MNDVTQPLHFQLTAGTPNGIARAQALATANEIQVDPTSVINYSSNGHVFILGSEDAARQAATELAKHASLVCTLILVDTESNINKIKLEAIPGNTQVPVKTELSATIAGTVVAVKGYLGNFDLILQTEGEQKTLRDIVGVNLGRIDIILDLTRLHLVSSEVKPPGYFEVLEYETDLATALREIPELVGDFEKPKFFNYDPEICAHSRSHITACTRCIDSCPTSAISSLGDQISVDANLCQGAGSCATACPTGAITYTYPQLRDSLKRLHAMLSTYQRLGGKEAIILFHDASTGREIIELTSDQIPDNVIPVELEELGSVGMDSWFSCLAYGAGSVILLATPQVPSAVTKELKAQLSYARAMLKALGYPANAIQLISDGDSSDFISSLATIPVRLDIPAAEFFDSNDKRKVIRAAVDHLYRYATAPKSLVSLPTGAPFGEVWVDETRCTLCMSCVWQCPGRALIAGGNQPQLKFVENDCVQCGMCARTCPEDAIGPSPRYLFDKEKRTTPRVLYEEQPFLCIKCGKAFASLSVIEKMTAKLKQHAMFQGDALQRIQMCEDCRVKDIYQAERNLHKENA